MKFKEVGLEQFGSDLHLKRRNKAIITIMNSIKETLRPIPKNVGKTYTYWDIVRCARANLGFGDDTPELVDEALRRLQLKEEFPKQ